MIRDSLHVLGVGRYTTKDTNTSLLKMKVQKDRNGLKGKEQFCQHAERHVAQLEGVYICEAVCSECAHMK